MSGGWALETKTYWICPQCSTHNFLPDQWSKKCKSCKYPYRHDVETISKTKRKYRITLNKEEKANG